MPCIEMRLPRLLVVSRLRVFFFFQAEDGIRDATVTGVQTCALPISDRDRRVDEEDRPPAHVLGQEATEHGADGQRECAHTGPRADRHAALLGGEGLEIGRASCRERGEISVGGGSVQAKEGLKGYVTE